MLYWIQAGAYALNCALMTGYKNFIEVKDMKYQHEY